MKFFTLYTAIIFILMSPITVTAKVPNMIPVQGTLTDKEGNVIVDDAAEILFSIYDSETEGNELWKERRTLMIDRGKLSVYLGELEPITYAKVGGKDELWLAITYDGEEMTRIRLASVPFAMEAQNAHNAEKVGKYSETNFDEMLAAACDEGFYLRGWSGFTPICEEDREGEGGTGTYTAGTGITIEGNVISADQSIVFSAGDGIEIDENNRISVSENIYSKPGHQHDNRYYTEAELDGGQLNNLYYTKAELSAGVLDSSYFKKDQDITTSKKLSFGATARQMLDLYDEDYGIGVQAGTQYYRSNEYFAWYKGGSHHNDAFNPGGGTMLMSLSSVGLGIPGQYYSGSGTNRLKTVGVDDGMSKNLIIIAGQMNGWKTDGNLFNTATPGLSAVRTGNGSYDVTWTQYEGASGYPSVHATCSTGGAKVTDVTSNSAKVFCNGDAWVHIQIIQFIN